MHLKVKNIGNSCALVLLVLAAKFAFLPYAQATPLKTVGSPVVNAGASSMEFRTGYAVDNKNPSFDGRFQSRLHYDYGFNDMYAIRLSWFQDKRGDDSYEHEAVMAENRFQFFERKDHGFDAGIRLTYMLRDGDKKPDIAEFRWITLVPYDAWEFRNQVIVQHQVGEDSDRGPLYELRWQINRQIGETKHRLGIEMFNELRSLALNFPYHTQTHDIGPVMTGPLFDGLRYHVGYRRGISEAAADHSVKFFIGYDF